MTGIPSPRSSPFQRAVSQMDWLLVLATLLLSLTGIFMIYSAIHSNPVFLNNSLHLKQALWASIGLCVLLCILFFDYRFFTRWAYFFYAIVIVLLIAVLLSGQVVYGAKRWLVFGPFRLQPSELARLAVILVLARYFGSRGEENPIGFKELIPAFALAARARVADRPATRFGHRTHRLPDSRSDGPRRRRQAKGHPHHRLPGNRMRTAGLVFSQGISDAAAF